MFDPKRTYEEKGAKRVRIAANGNADNYRIGTLQVLIRNRINAKLPRRGQPPLTMCFRGTGQRISKDEWAAYRSDVVVQFQPKAWYDSALTKKWVAQYAMNRITKTGLATPGEKNLLLCDNLGSQTNKTNARFSELLAEKCNCDVWNLLASCTDEMQVVDAGFGACVKRHADNVIEEWLDTDANWDEWTEQNLTASRKRVLLTHWYGEAYERACISYDFVKVFNSCGSNLTADGSEDQLVKLQGLAEFSSTTDDAKQDALPGRQITQHFDQAPLGYLTRRGTYLPPLFLSGVRGQPGFLPTPAICAFSNNHRT